MSCLNVTFPFKAHSVSFISIALLILMNEWHSFLPGCSPGLFFYYQWTSSEGVLYLECPTISLQDLLRSIMITASLIRKGLFSHICFAKEIHYYWFSNAKNWHVRMQVREIHVFLSQKNKLSLRKVVYESHYNNKMFPHASGMINWTGNELVIGSSFVSSSETWQVKLKWWKLNFLILIKGKDVLVKSSNVITLWWKVTGGFVDVVYSIVVFGKAASIRLHCRYLVFCFIA